MKIPNERIKEIKSLFQPDGTVRQQDKTYFCRRAEAAIPELLSEREEREGEIEERRNQERKASMAMMYLAGKLAPHVKEDTVEIMLNAIKVASEELAKEARSILDGKAVK